jgi:hypothetical protein
MNMFRLGFLRAAALALSATVLAGCGDGADQPAWSAQAAYLDVDADGPSERYFFYAQLVYLAEQGPGNEDFIGPFAFAIDLDHRTAREIEPTMSFAFRDLPEGQVDAIEFATEDEVLRFPVEALERSDGQEDALTGYAWRPSLADCPRGDDIYQCIDERLVAAAVEALDFVAWLEEQERVDVRAGATSFELTIPARPADILGFTEIMSDRCSTVTATGGSIAALRRAWARSRYAEPCWFSVRPRACMTAGKCRRPSSRAARPSRSARRVSPA